MRELFLFSALLQLALCELEPQFNSTPEHLRIKQGSRAILPCSVVYIGGHQVVWSSPRKTLISLEDRRLIDDQRISVERPYIKEWNLHIRNVRYNDSGTYKCEINTNPIQFKEVTLKVVVPPTIISKLSSDNLKLRESETAELVCNVTGVPHPNVTWFKRNFRLGRGHKERIGLEGEVLIIHNVTRYCDDIYECYVDNGIPPAVSKAIRVVVEFPPEVVMTNKRIGHRLGRETILECSVYGNPQGLTFWKKNGRQIITDERFTVEAYEDIENRIVTLSLRINPLEKQDFGRYVCEGSNHLGMDREEMVLYEIEPEITTTPSTTQRPFYEVLPDIPDDVDEDKDEESSYVSDRQRPGPASTIYPDQYPGKYPDKLQPTRSPTSRYSGETGNDPRSILRHRNCASDEKYTFITSILTVINIWLIS
ncbi:lachesin-like [Haliotis cracherodii]|uniref:lachesin-like n=1 Tax=Haliotis rufescens TaxID=6454 RepID=UPI001EB0460B|nr:lachesin-like [Haliotis rufescens]